MDKKILLFVASAILLAGCSNSSSSKTVIKFEFIDAGFGTTPYQNIAKAYEKEHPNVSVKLIPNANIEGEFPTKITTGTNLSDLVIYHSYNGGAKILNWAKKGLLYDFSSRLDEEVETGVTLRSMLDDNSSVMGVYQNGFYAIPEYYSISGFVYNATMFEANDWETPKTTAEMKTLFDKINNTEYLGKSVKPIVYSGGTGGADGYFYNAIDGWMTSYEGVANMKRFYEFASAEVYNPSVSGGKIQGMTKLMEFFNNSEYVLNKSDSKSALEAQSDLIGNKAAMMVNGCWFENEMKNYLTEESPTFKMCVIPEVADATGEIIHADGYTTSEDKQVISTNFNTFCIIPNKAKNTEGAFDLLKFMSRKDICEQYTLDTNAVRPLNYNYSSTNSKYENMSEFGKSILDIASNYCLYSPISSAPVYIANKATLYPQGGYWYKRMFGDPSKYTPQYCVQSDYDYAVANWNDWLRAAEN